MDQTTPQAEYKPNIYPIMYWALLYGIIAASILLVLHLLSNLITWIWFPVFLAGVVWGGFRKYQQDKAAWAQSSGVPITPKTPVQEFKDAARDIAQAGSEMIARQAQEDKEIAQAVQEEIVAQENVATVEETPAPENTAPAEETVVAETPQEVVPAEQEEPATEEQPRPPQSPLQPLV